MSESERDSEKPAEEPAEAGESDSTEPRELSPEEQMALYEESLKESDWGHQPC